MEPLDTNEQRERPPGLPDYSRDRKTGYTKTGYMEEAKTRILWKSNLAPNGPKDWSPAEFGTAK